MSLKSKRIIIIFAVICCSALIFCLLSNVQFESGAVNRYSRNITLAIHEGETVKLNKFSRLKNADFSGSTCYEEIMQWEQQHPDVEVRYTVELPDGRLADSRDESLSLDFTDSSSFHSTAVCLEYLPHLKSVEFNCPDEDLRLEAQRVFAAVRPDINYILDFLVGGRRYSTDSAELEFRRIGSADAKKIIDLLPTMHTLKRLDLGSDAASPDLSFSDIALMEKARPDVEFLFDFSFSDRHFSINDTTLDLNHIAMSDEGERARGAMACMPELRYVDMDSCGVSDEAMAEIRDAYPDVKVVWRVWFGRNYSVRTDVETILASMPSKGGNLHSGNCQSIKYCTDVKYLDLGHSEILDDISFVSYMPKLEVAILAMATWSDTSPLADCPELEYLEIQTTKITDLSPLAGLKKLKHLNICYLYGLEDISPLYNLPQLERLWIGCLDPVPAEQIEKMQSIAPDCVINTTTLDPTDGGWRYLSESRGGVNGLAPRYALLREQFKYDDGLSSYAFFWNDPKY